MKAFYHIARTVRHAPLLRHMTPLWNALRSPYLRILDRGNGVSFTLGRSYRVQIPAQYTQFDWEGYETEAMEAIGDWVTSHPDALVLDVGCAVGIVSSLVLWTAPESRVIAFDADLASLTATDRVTRRAIGDRTERVKLVYGLVSATHASAWSLDEADRATRVSIRTSARATATPRFVCLTDPRVDSIPVHSLDGLLERDVTPRMPVLVKIDVEGAEVLVLQGARRILAEIQPVVLVSVHPQFLGKYGHTVNDVKQILEVSGYKISVLSVDHEEHWWCQPIGA